jgi:hypothetical protein
MIQTPMKMKIESTCILSNSQTDILHLEYRPFIYSFILIIITKTLIWGIERRGRSWCIGLGEEEDGVAGGQRPDKKNIGGIFQNKN